MSPPSPAEQALAVVELARAGRFADIRAQFPPVLRRLVSVTALSTAWADALARGGALVSVGEPELEPPRAGVVAVRVPLVFERSRLTLAMGIRRGYLLGIQALPDDAAPAQAPWEPPDYADPDGQREEEVDVAGVPGTLTVPRAAPTAAAVLLPGSGPVDRDETIGATKPFRDLAWGLAAHGVAVARFDKVTYADPERFAARDDVTVDDEYLPQAMAAIDLVRARLGVRRIVVIGHSLGATIGPRVAQARPELAGLVLLAAGATPLHWAMVRQFRYLADLDPTGAGVSAETVAAVTAQARLVDDPGLGPDTPAEDLPFGVPAPYWLDLRAYDAPALAAGLALPLLILQGERDYQVTVSDDLALWRARLADRPSVTIRVYPGLDHLFARGSDPSTPADYTRARHVDPAVIADIAGWIAAL